MSQRHQVGTVLPGYNPLKVANAPTIGTATAGGSNCASVTFTAPSCIGGAAISSYTAYANCGVRLTSGASSPLVITGLTSGTSYTFKVIATNLYGPSGPSSASSSITARVQGQVLYCTSGTFSWVAPAGVTSVSVVAVGIGAQGSGNRSGNMNGGGGGALAYTNNITVVPGNSYTVTIPNSSSGTPVYNASSFQCNPKARNGGGCSGLLGYGACAGTVLAGTGYSGGTGGAAAFNAVYGGGGGGGAGYSGKGGNGGATCQSGVAGVGGGGGGGAWYGYGGGVGLLGEGTSGAGGVGRGTNGGVGSSGSGRCYGGGGNGNGANGGKGAVRIIWPGTTRSFPSTNTGDL